MSQAYKLKTKLLGIPVPDYGDTVWPEMELKRFQIVENMLMAGLRGAVNAVFEEGLATVAKGEDGKFRVTLSATGSSPSLTGTVGGAYFDAPSTVAWEGLEEGRTYFLYLRGSPKTFLEPSEVRAVSSPRRLRDSVSVLVAKVTTDGDKAAVDMNPDGKVHARDLARHVTDWENPHGTSVAQDELLVSGKLALGEDAVMDFGGAVVPAKEVAAALAAASRKTRRVVDFASGGPSGVVLEGCGSVSFVAVSRRGVGRASPESRKNVGEVAVGYFGEDEDVKRPDQFVVRNEGDAGVPMRALVVCG